MLYLLYLRYVLLLCRHTSDDASTIPLMYEIKLKVTAGVILAVR